MNVRVGAMPPSDILTFNVSDSDSSEWLPQDQGRHRGHMSQLNELLTHVTLRRHDEEFEAYP